MSRTRAARGSVGWILGSISEREDALALLQWDEPTEPRDELGAGALRDAFANAFFPGITTQQRGAKYFLLVPAMYARLEADVKLRRSPSAAIEELERELLFELLAHHERADVIGGRFRRVPQTPSSAIYWSGLYTWRIRRFSDSRPRYHGWLAAPRERLSQDDPEDEGGDERVRWLEIPGGDSVLAEPMLDLSRTEAEFLRDCIFLIKAKPETPLLRELLDQPLSSGQAFWDVPLIRQKRASLAAEALDSGRLSVAMHGAMTFYNLLCAQHTKSKHVIDDWSANWEHWSHAHPAEEWAAWNRDAFWERVSRLPDGSRAIQRTRSFVDGWVDALSRPNRGAARERGAMEQLVVRRERLTKPGRERLSPPYASHGWTSGGVGVAPLDFRWRSASRIILDIQRGLEQ